MIEKILTQEFAGKITGAKRVSMTIHFRAIARHLVASVVFAAFLGMGSASYAQSIKIKVNDTSISENQISQRAKLISMEQRGKSNSARRRLAQEELITEALQMQEARRLQISIADAGIDQAYAKIATRVKMNSGRLTQVLNAAGIQSKTLKDRLRASALWIEIVSNSIRQDIRVSEKEVIEALGEDTKQEVTTFDYLLKEVMFFVPKGASQKTQLSQARAFKAKYGGCESAVTLSLGFTDAGVRTIGRRHSTQFPEALAGELSALTTGGITSPRVTKNGIQMLAVCAKTQARDIHFVSRDKRNELGNVKLAEAAKSALKALRDNATIVYR